MKRAAARWLVWLGMAAGTCAHGAMLEVRLGAVFDGAPLLLDSLRYGLESGEEVSVSRLSMLLSGFAVRKGDGTWVELPGQYAWMDAGSRRMSVMLRDVPEGRYGALRFALGPDAAANDGRVDQYAPDDPLNPNLNGLYWSWMGGYVFLALEGACRSSGTGVAPGGYSYHLARDENRRWVTIEAPMEVREAAGMAVLVEVDVGRLLGGLSPERDGNSTHSRAGDAVAGRIGGNVAGAFRARGVAAAMKPGEMEPVKPLYLPAVYTPYPFRVRGGFPLPELPADNPLLVERVELGRMLFHDPGLSRDGTISCASCHQEAEGFSDVRRLSLGVRGAAGTRHAMPLLNLAWKRGYFWDGRAPTLREQVMEPIRKSNEMDEDPGQLAEKLERRREYAEGFVRAFGPGPVTREKVGLALENFLLTLTSYDSKFDAARRGQTVMTGEEQRGMQLFFTEYDPRTGQYGADCFHCHGGPFFTDHQFHDNGLGESSDTGRNAVTGLEADRGKFATPSLRNVALRSRYMHDGRFGTLEEVVEHYATGVKRDANLDPNLAKHPGAGVPLSAADKAALVAFLKTLTDPRLAGRPGPGAGGGGPGAILAGPQAR